MQEQPKRTVPVLDHADASSSQKDDGVEPDDEKCGSVASTVGGKCEHDVTDLVHFVVGGYHYTIQRKILLALSSRSGDEKEEEEEEEEKNYFRTLLSDRWKRPKLSQPLEIKDRNGRLFFYVLYYLEHVDLPRGQDSPAWRCVLSDEDLKQLKDEAQFFGLVRLVELCEEVLTGAVLKGVKGSGDLDLSHISNFAVDISHNHTKHESEFSFDIRYKYDDTKVSVCGDMSFAIGAHHFYAYVGSEKVLSDGPFLEVFARLQDIIAEEHEKKIAAAGTLGRSISVTHVLSQTDIRPELHLWYAFVITDMIEYYSNYGNWNGEFDDGIGFLFSDTTSSIYTEMKSTPRE